MTLTLTFGEIVGWGTGLIVLSSVVSIVTQWIKTLLKPSKRIQELEIEIKRDSKAIKEVREDSKVMQKALIALLESNINGDNKDELRAAKRDLNEHLIER